MAQHDQVIADQGGLAFLSDLNNALTAIFSNNSGATEPSVTAPYMWWADTTAGWLKQRNAADNAWINKMPLADAMSTVGALLFSAADAAAARSAIGALGASDDIFLAAGKIISFEGTTDDAYETTLSAGDPTADRVIALPDMSGTVAVQARGADIASAGTINLTTATGDIVDVTGTTSITAIILADGLERQVRFTGALTLTNGASLVLPSGANITTAAGDFAVFRGYASSVVRCVAYIKANGQPVVGGGIGNSMVRLNTANGYGSTNTKIRRFTNTVTNTGSDITYADSATNGASFTINTSGIYSISYSDNFNAADYNGISLNMSGGTTAITNLTISQILSVGASAGSSSAACCSWTGYLTAGDVVRPHTFGSASGSVTGAQHFTIARVG